MHQHIEFLCRQGKGREGLPDLQLVHSPPQPLHGQLVACRLGPPHFALLLQCSSQGLHLSSATLLCAFVSVKVIPSALFHRLSPTTVLCTASSAPVGKPEILSSVLSLPSLGVGESRSICLTEGPVLRMACIEMLRHAACHMYHGMACAHAAPF